MDMRSSSKIESVELLRGLAAVSVTLFHFSGRMENELSFFFHTYGWLGVDAFFVISGFVISLSLSNSNYRVRNFFYFIGRRIIRLEPSYLASILLVLLLWHASALAPGFRGHPAQYDSYQVIFHLFYIIPLTDYDWLNPVYWTLAYEFLFYIFMGIFFNFLNFFGPIHIVILGFSLSSIPLLYGSDFDHRILEFALGILLFIIWEARFSRISAWLSLSVTIAGISLLGDLTTAAICAATGIAILGGRTISCGRVALFLGAISYSLYLTHVPVGGRVVNLGLRYVDSPIGELIVCAAALILSIAFAAVFSRLIEEPSHSASRRIWRR